MSGGTEVKAMALRVRVAGLRGGRRCHYCFEPGAEVAIAIWNDCNGTFLLVELHRECAEKMAEVLSLALEEVAREVSGGE